MQVPQTPLRFLDRATRVYPDTVGVVCGAERWTYAEFGARVNRLSHALRSLGVQPGDRVAFLSLNCHRLLEAYFGVVQIGAILLPLNVRLSPSELAFILNDAEARLLCVDPPLLPVARTIEPHLASLRRFILLSDGAGDALPAWPSYEVLLAAAPADPPARAEIDEIDVAELFYTSGTTGQPKGVMLTHRNLYANGMNMVVALGLTDRDVQLHTIPLFHVNGWGAPHAVTAVGARHVILRQFTPASFFTLVQQERVTSCGLVPTMLNALLNAPERAQYDLSSLRQVVVGGAPMPPSFVTAAMETFGCDCFAGYGLTETSPILTIAHLKPELRRFPLEEQAVFKAKTGLPIPGVEVRVVNPLGQEVQPNGQEVGEIVARGDVVMPGYWRRPEETAAVIRDGWFFTGDMAVVDEHGYLLIVDRKKDIIISGGENISSVEIENTLYRHPAVLEAAVIAAPDDYWGEVPRALVVLKPGASATAEELIAFCRERIAHFKAPRAVEFLPELPKTGTGKIAKAALRERYWQGYAKRVH